MSRMSRMSRETVAAVLAVLTCACAAVSQTSSTGNFDIATVETTADGSVHGDTFAGTEEILSAAGPGDAVLLRFRTASIEKWTVYKAVIAFHLAEGSAAPAEIIMTGVDGAWSEGSVTPPLLGQGMSVATHKLKDGWITVELPMAIARQLAGGSTASVAISVADGSRLSLHSRRTGQFMPYLLVRGQRPLSR